MINLIFIDESEITEQDKESIRSAGLSDDDFDYVILLPSEILTEEEYDYIDAIEQWKTITIKQKRFVLKENIPWRLESLIGNNRTKFSIGDFRDIKNTGICVISYYA